MSWKETFSRDSRGGGIPRDDGRDVKMFCEVCGFSGVYPTKINAVVDGWKRSKQRFGPGQINEFDAVCPNCAEEFLDEETG